MKTLTTTFEGREVPFDYFSEIIKLSNDHIITIYSVILKDKESKIIAGEHFHLVQNGLGLGTFNIGFTPPVEEERKKREKEFKDAVKKAIIE